MLLLTTMLPSKIMLLLTTMLPSKIMLLPTPTLQRDEHRTSGAMYSTVPTGLIASSWRVLMVSPKSPSLMTCSPVKKMFSNLMSLCAKW